MYDPIIQITDKQVTTETSVKCMCAFSQRRHSELWRVFKCEGQAECIGHQTILPSQLQKQIWVAYIITWKFAVLLHTC